jgi:hypothetical protein
MNPRLQKLYSEIETQRKMLLLSVRNLSYEKLNNYPPDKWSINQIIAHLISAENLSVQYIKKKILGVNQVENTGFTEELKMLLLVASQRLPLKFKAPKVVVEHTSKATDITKLTGAWEETRLELRNILERMEDQHLQKKIYKHVRVGMLNIQHALKFFREHVKHHMPQVKYLLKQK